MTTEELVARLQRMVDTFDTDDCIDWAYYTVEELENLIEEMAQ